MALLLVMAAGCSLPAAANTSQAAATPEETLSAPETTPFATPVMSAEETPSETPAVSLEPTPEATPVQPLTVTEGKIVKSNADVSVNAVYPVISGMADPAVQSGINEQVRVWGQDEANRIETGSQAVGHPHEPYTFESAFQVKRNDGRILSIRIQLSYYNGGANTGSEAAFINIINTSPAQQPTLSQLFLAGADFAAVLNGRINAMIADNPDAEMFDFHGISSSQGYYLTPTSLVIVFERYSIAPGVVGEPEFVIPFAELGDILIPEVL